MNRENVIRMVTRKCGKPPQPQRDEALGEIASMQVHPDVREYLCHCLPFESYKASEINVLPWEKILREMGEASVPGSFIRPFGYIIIATSVGGNVVCVHQTSGRVFWADHDSFSTDMIMFENRATATWEYLYNYSAENVERALVFISDSLEVFLMDFLTDQLTAQLDALD